jgi:hypothetical protein
MLMFCLHIGQLLLGDAMVTLLSPPFPHLWGPHSLIAGALGCSSLPLGCSAGLAVPPFEVFGGFVSTRARVSLGLGLAPALLLGCALPLMLSF